MKKFVGIALVLAMLFTVAACGKSGGGKAEETGLWGYETIEIDVDKYNQGLEAEMQITAEEAESFKSFYDMFLAGMYFEFKGDGNGILGYVVDEDSGEVEMQPTKFTYADKKFSFPADEDPGFSEFEIKDGKLYVILADEDVQGMTLVCKKVDSLDDVKSNMQDIMNSLESLLGN